MQSQRNDTISRARLTSVAENQRLASKPGGEATAAPNDPSSTSASCSSTSLKSTTTSSADNNDNARFTPQFDMYVDHIMDPISNVWPYIVRGSYGGSANKAIDQPIQNEQDHHSRDHVSRMVLISPSTGRMPPGTLVSPEAYCLPTEQFVEICLLSGDTVGRPTTFPWLLYCMLEDCSNASCGNPSVSWVGHGRAFRIHDRQSFQQHIMPRYDTKTPQVRYVLCTLEASNQPYAHSYS